MSALETQIGGTHYSDLPIQPVEFIHKNGLGFIVGNIIKYIIRYPDKNGVQDLLKAKHYLEILIEMEDRKATSSSSHSVPLPDIGDTDR